MIYGTRHLRGLEKFREVEAKEIKVQEQVRLEAKDLQRIARTHTPFLFTAADLPLPDASLPFEEEFLEQQRHAESRLDALLQEHGRVSYDFVLGQLLSMPLVWEDAIKRMVRERRKAGLLEIDELKGREQTPKKGYHLTRKK